MGPGASERTPWVLKPHAWGARGPECKDEAANRLADGAEQVAGELSVNSGKGDEYEEWGN